MIDRATVDKIIDSARIVDVVGEFVTLRKAGVNYKGLCPFHDDKNPSFMVSPAKNICHCFVCGKGGTPVGFLMEHEQMTYPEALRWLAKKYHIEIVEKELSKEELEQQNAREAMFVVNEWAAKYFNETMKTDPDGIAIGKQYFRSRGIRDDIIEKFRLGFALPQRTALSTAAIKAGYKADYLLQTGLCYSVGDNDKPESGKRAGLVDRYAGRVIFPWFNISGKVVAFGGRKLDAATKGVQQKYVNSPESEIFHKERELYGIYQAKKAIVREDCVFMVEGYTDVLAMHQAGIENVVANSGTALSHTQIQMLHRFTQNITLLYDGDEAGIHAAMRGTDMLLEHGMKVRVLLLPDGDDPDSFARKHSSTQLREYIAENQTDFITFKSRLTVENTTDPVKRAEAIAGIVKSISVVPDQILRTAYITDFSLRVGMKEETLVNELNKYVRKNIEEKSKERDIRQQREAEQQQQDDGSTVEVEAPQRIAVSQKVSNRVEEVELLLLREVVRHGHETIFSDVETEDGSTISINVAQYIHYDLSQDGISLSRPVYQRMLEEAVDKSSDEAFNATSYFCSHSDLDISRLATALAVERHQLGGRFVVNYDERNLQQRVVHLILDLRFAIMENKLRSIERQLRQAGNDVRHSLELLREHKETKVIRDMLAKRIGNELVTKK